MTQRFDFDVRPAADTAESIRLARALVAHVAAGLPLEPEVNLSATVAAASAANVFLAVVLQCGLTEAEAEAAAELAIFNVRRHGFFDPAGGRPSVQQ